jgi:hypothetical protein
MKMSREGDKTVRCVFVSTGGPNKFQWPILNCAIEAAKANDPSQELDRYCEAFEVLTRSIARANGNRFFIAESEVYSSRRMKIQNFCNWTIGPGEFVMSVVLEIAHGQDPNQAIFFHAKYKGVLRF